jgi:hypothetical protein
MGCGEGDIAHIIPASARVPGASGGNEVESDEE